MGCGAAGAALLLTGIGFNPVLRWGERIVGRATPFTLSVGGAHFSFAGDLYIKNIVLRRGDTLLLDVPTVVVDPGWAALGRGSLRIDGVEIEAPSVLVNEGWVVAGSTESSGGGIGALGAVVHGVTIRNGRLRLGSSDDWALLDLRCSLNGSNVRVRELNFVQGEGVLKASGTVSLDTQKIDLSGVTESFPVDDVARAFAPVPESVRVQHTGFWRWTGTFDQWEARLEGLLKSEKATVTTSLRALLDGGRGEMEGTLTHVDGRAWVKASLDIPKKYLAATFDVTVSSLAALGPFWAEMKQAGGAVTVHGNVKGPWVSPLGTVRVQGAGLRYQGLGIETLQAQIERGAGKEDPLRFRVTGASVTWVAEGGKVWRIPRVEGAWVGSDTDADLDWKFVLSDGTSADGRGPVQRRKDRVVWSWDRLGVLFPGGKKFSAEPGGSIERQSSGTIEVKNLQWGPAGKSLRLQRFTYGGENIFLKGSAENVGFRFLKSETDLQNYGLTGRVTGDIRLEGPLDNPVGQFDFRVSSGVYQSYPALNIFIKGTVGDGRISLPEILVKSEALPALRVHGSLPWAWVIGAGGQETMDLSLDPLELDPAKLLKGNPDVKVGPGGFLRVGGRVVGKKNNLSVEGELVGGVPSLKIPLAEVDVSDLRLDLELRNQRLRVRQVRAKWGKGFFRLSGESFLPNLSLDIEGKDISFRVPRRLAMKTDLNLHVGGTLSHPVLTGDIPVTEATYEVEKKKSKEPEKETNETFLHLWDILKLNVNTGWKNNVWYRDGLTKVETKADVVVSKEGGDRIPGVTGVVSIVRGNYDAYGKDFVLKSGEFVFTDPTELNPQVTLRALHKMRDYLIELNVSGTARRPELRFQSTPPLPEPDILALLAIGKAPGQGAGESSSGAADLAAGWASDFLTREIRSAGMNVLDLDVVRVSPTDKGTEWTVGRYWGSKLFLSFSYIADESASQVLKGEYSLSPQWYLVGQTGSKSDNYVDLNFRLPVGKSRIKE